MEILGYTDFIKLRKFLDCYFSKYLYTFILGITHLLSTYLLGRLTVP